MSDYLKCPVCLRWHEPGSCPVTPPAKTPHKCPCCDGYGRRQDANLGNLGTWNACAACVALLAERRALRGALVGHDRVFGEARELLSSLSDYASGTQGRALMLTLDHIDKQIKSLRALLRGDGA